MKIVLLGYMGSGKSLVGKALAEAINKPFVDLDMEIEKMEDCSITELFRNKGEIFFRKRERTILENLMEREKSFVLSLGGGTPCFGNTMEFLNSKNTILTIYLKASNETLTNRLFTEIAERPLIQHISAKEDLNDFIRKHLFERSFYYNQAIKKIIVDEKEASTIVSEIVAQLY